jgi:hypothetical protein
MMRDFIWVTGAVLCIGMIAYFTAQSSMEDSKQLAFLGEACIKAGGQWKHNWGSHYDCVRPKDATP